MTHRDIVVRGNRLHAVAHARFPDDRMQQAVFVTADVDALDAYALAVSDCALGRVYNRMTDDERGAWALRGL